MVYTENMEQETKHTMVRIEKSTATRIKDLKLAKLESYDEILNRVLPDEE